MSPAAASPESTARPEVDLAPGTLVLGDVHLDVERRDRAAAFAGELRRLAGVPRIVVLGDLFEYWIGSAQAHSPGARDVLGAFAELTGGGTAVDVIPGNRDFLLDEDFERRTGARLRPDGLVGRRADGARVLLVHGDELCTADHAYQRLRRVVRSRALRGLARRTPAPVGRALARLLRRTSRRAVERKAAPVTEQRPEAAEALAREANADALVCGHAHRFRDEPLGNGVRWCVVDAWGGARDVLVVGADGFAPLSRDGEVTRVSTGSASGQSRAR